MPTYYISPFGNDSDPGTIGQPFLTFVKAESVVAPGDTVLIADGTYGGWTTSLSGGSSTRIIFRALNPGMVNLTGDIVSTHDYRNYDGFAFSGVTGGAMDIIGGNNIIRNITVAINYGTGYGIKIGVDANTGGSVASNNVLENIRIVSTFSGAQTVHGVLFGGGGNGNILRNSYFSGVYYGVVDKCDTNTLVYNNVFNFFQAGLYTCIYSKGATDGLYVHNVIRQTGDCFGVLMAPSDGGSPQSVGSQIMNNIFIKGTDPSIYNAGTGSFTSDYNIFQTSGGILAINSATNYSTLAAWQATGHDTHSISGTPTFVNSSGTLTQITDYQPLGGSPVINAGVVTFRTLDAGGNSAVSQPDLGAWEYTVTGNTYWIATDGNDSNSGTSISSPWLHLEKISSIALLPGDVVNIRAGTYDSYAPLFAVPTFQNILISNKSGTPGAHIIIQGYPPDFVGGGRVVYNCLNEVRATGAIGIMTNNCSYIDFFDISIVGPAQEDAGGGTGTYAAAWWFSSDTSNTNITANNCEASFSMQGFRLDNVNNATYNNCDAHEIDDPYTGPPTGPHNNSDGFSRTNVLNTATNTVYNYCRAWFCADDGWDCFDTPGSITYNGCWSFFNGYSSGMVHLGDGNGFKMGGPNSTGTRLATFNISYGNYANGFDQNAGNFVGTFYNNSSINNGLNDWKFGYNPPIPHVFRNNLSFGNSIIDGLTTDADFWGVDDHNSWNGGVTLTSGDFLSTDDSQFSGARQADGSLPVITAYQLDPGSDLIDAGVDVGLPFNDAAPDIGFEAVAAAPETGTTITSIAIAFTPCDIAPLSGFYQVNYRVVGDTSWISGGSFATSPAIITGLSYPVGTLFEAQVLNADCDSIFPDIAGVGVLFHFEIPLVGSMPFALIINDKPSWLNISISGSTLIFDGTPDVAGTDVPIDILVTNCTSGSAPLAVTIDVVELGAFIVYQDVEPGSELGAKFQWITFDESIGYIDWGDGTLEAFDTPALSSTILIHTYAAAGTYEQRIYFDSNVHMFGFFNSDVGFSEQKVHYFNHSDNFTLFNGSLSINGVYDLPNCIPTAASNINSLSLTGSLNDSPSTSVDFSGFILNVTVSLNISTFPNLTTVDNIPSYVLRLGIGACEALASINAGGDLPSAPTQMYLQQLPVATIGTFHLGAMTNFDTELSHFTTSEINAFLVALDANGISNGNVNVSQQIPAAPPSGAGITAVTNLIGKGWSVATD